MKESLYKSIAEIMTWFDWEKMVEIEEKCVNTTCDTNDKSIDAIKEYALKNLFECAERFQNEKENCWMKGAYSLCFKYVYDEDEPIMQLKYVPVSWEG